MSIRRRGQAFAARNAAGFDMSGRRTIPAPTIDQDGRNARGPRVVRRGRPTPVARTSAGLCLACSQPIDARTAECGCSA